MGSTSEPTGQIDTPEPLRYQQDVLAYLRDNERPLWNWFASHKRRGEYAEAVRMDLLKSTYRLDRGNHRDLYEKARAAASRLGIAAPVTLYQAQQAQSMNVSLAYTPGEAHIVLQGDVQSLLADREFEAMFGHELGHFLLWERWDGSYLVASDLLAALTRDPSADPVHVESARLFGLYGEAYCDRVALQATGDLLTVVSTLIKIETGLKNVSAGSYLAQAAEIFSSSDVKADGLTHPEVYIRTRALQLFDQGAEDTDRAVARMIEGDPGLDTLDLLGQRRVADLTRRLIDRVLSKPWMRTDANLSHARLFFDKYAPPGAGDPSLPTDLKTSDEALRKYYTYVLLDFVAADRALEEAPLAWGLLLAEELGLAELFEKAARKELSLIKKVLQRVRKDAEKTVAAADRELPKPGEGSAP